LHRFSPRPTALKTDPKPNLERRSALSRGKKSQPDREHPTSQKAVLPALRQTTLQKWQATQARRRLPRFMTELGKKPLAVSPTPE
jgi:hypothetical protein